MHLFLSLAEELNKHEMREEKQEYGVISTSRVQSGLGLKIIQVLPCPDYLRNSEIINKGLS